MTDLVTIRLSRPTDEPALSALAALDSTRLRARPVVVAEQEGELRAALALDSGKVIADPFHRTAELVDLLELRAAQLRSRRADRPVSAPARGHARLVTRTAGGGA